ncbi:MAG: hypothetical protein QXT45_07895 [Candidatus Bilamarchaeaceae archaeon]
MLTEKHIKYIHLIGRDSDHNPVFHIETKGGHHQFIKKVSRDRYVVLGHGPSRGHAKRMALELDKTIIFNDDLFKSEGAVDVSQASVVDADNLAEICRKQAEWYAQKIEGAHDAWAKVYYTMKTIQHLRVAGIDHSNFLKAFNEKMQNTLLRKSMPDRPPYNEDVLEVAMTLRGIDSSFDDLKKGANSRQSDAMPMSEPGHVFVLFSADNPRYKPSLNWSHERTVAELRQKNFDVKELQGVYQGVPERSIAVKVPSHDHQSISHLHNIVRRLGQNSYFMVHPDRHELIEFQNDGSIKTYSGTKRVVYDTEPKHEPGYVLWPSPKGHQYLVYHWD